MTSARLELKERLRLQSAQESHDQARPSPICCSALPHRIEQISGTYPVQLRVTRGYDD